MDSLGLGLGLYFRLVIVMRTCHSGTQFLVVWGWVELEVDGMVALKAISVVVA